MTIFVIIIFRSLFSNNICWNLYALMYVLCAINTKETELSVVFEFNTICWRVIQIAFFLLIKLIDVFFFLKQKPVGSLNNKNI